MARKLCLATMLLFSFLWQPASYASGTSSSNVPVIAAASDLSYALGKVSAQFSQETGNRVRISFGSSGNLKRLIEQGAPFELFMSADENYVFQLAEQGHTFDQGQVYALGRLVLFAAHGSALAKQLDFSALPELLSNGKIRKFAIANPRHAPYGRAARETLQNVKLWQQIEGSLVLGESASQTTLFAASGAAQGAIIPHALALNPSVSEKGAYRLISHNLHKPLRQRMVLLKNAGTTAQQFYEYLQTSAAREIMREYGFTVSGEL